MANDLMLEALVIHPAVGKTHNLKLWLNWPAITGRKKLEEPSIHQQNYFQTFSPLGCVN